MPGCDHRLVRERTSHCWLQSHRSTVDGRCSLVFRGEEEGWPILCDEVLSQVCPFREGDGDPPKLANCPFCGRCHRPGSNSKRLCEEWHSVKEVLKKMRQDREGMGHYPTGTRQLPYSDDTPELIRRLIWLRLKPAVLRRDRYRCQDCGVNFGKRRRKVFCPELRRGRGGHRWESLEVHHIIPRSRGGSDHPGNLKTLCPSCHRKYTSELAVDRAGELRKRKDRLRSLAAAWGQDEVGYDDPRD